MKEIFGEEEDESRFKEAFNEIEIMKILRHRNIIGFIDSFIENKSFYIVMPVAMNSVSQLQKYRIKNCWGNCIIGREVAEGLALIHSNNLVHLDLKPDNIFLDEDESPLIGDFGISNQALRREIQEYVTTDQGTMPYLAPEIWLGKEFKLEPDIFAYGIILYELLTGKRPFTPSFFGGYSEVICAGKYDEGELEKMKTDDDAKMHLIELIRGCLEVERKKRLKIWDVLGQINMIHGNLVLPPIYSILQWYICWDCNYDLCMKCIKQLPTVFTSEGTEQFNEEVPKCKNGHQMGLIYSYNIGEMIDTFICDGCKTLIYNPSQATEDMKLTSYIGNRLDNIDLQNTDGVQTKYYFYYPDKENQWVSTENDHLIAMNYDIFGQIICHPAFVAQMKPSTGFWLKYQENIYFINSHPVCIFYTEIFKQRKVLKQIDILKWLIEIIFPIKYLHDNNIYYHNLSVHNLLLDQHQRLSLAPSNFPFHLYFTQVKIFEWYEYIHNSSFNIRYIRTKEFPILSKEMIELEVREVFEFWYELCTKMKFTSENTNFDLIENFYGPRWRSLIENSLTKELVVATWHDLNSTNCSYISLYLELLHEEWEILMKQNIFLIDEPPEPQNENAKGEEISKGEEEVKMPYNEDAEVDVPSITLALPILEEERTIPENEKEDQVLRQNSKSEYNIIQRSSQGWPILFMLLPYSLIINLVLIREECEIVDQHSENAEGEGISKVEEEPKISYTEDTEVDVPSIPLSLLTLEERTIPEEHDQVFRQNLTGEQGKDSPNTRTPQNEPCCCRIL